MASGLYTSPCRITPRYGDGSVEKRRARARAAEEKEGENSWWTVELAERRTRQIRDMGLAELADHPDDVYRAQVQISELNAMNACLAVMRYKQVRGFYLEKQTPFHMLFDITELKLVRQEGP